MTDEECIALAMLHGAELWDCAAEGWYISPIGKDHPLEKERWSQNKNGWPSRAAAARAYCKYHQLLEKVT